MANKNILWRKLNLTERHTQLTSAEIVSIWTAYMNDSMSKCILGYLLKTVEDEEIKAVVHLGINCR